MEYIKNGFIDEDDYLDYVDRLRRYHTENFKEPSPKFWIDGDNELKCTIKENLNKNILLLELLEKQKSELENRISNTNLIEVEEFWFGLVIDLIFKKRIILLKRLISYCKLALYKPKENKTDTITDEQIEIVKLIPIEDFISEVPRINGNKLFFHCPFHEEKSGSFVVFKNTNRYNCFGCGKNGDIINFIMETKKLNFIDAVKFLL